MKPIHKNPSDGICLELEEAKENDIGSENKPNDVTENSNNASRRNRSNSATSEASVSFFDRLWPRDYSCFKKVLWCLAVLICTVICFWQLGDRISYYVQEPTTFQVTVERLHEIQFPAVTICPAREPFRDEVFRQAFNIPHFFDELELNVTVDDVWSAYAVTEEDIFVMASCNESNYCDFLNGVNTTGLKMLILPTFWGSCLTVYREKPIEFRGASTYLEIFLRPGYYNREWFGRDVAAQYFFHEPQAVYRHDAFLLAELWTQGTDTLIQIAIKEFDFLNSSKNPCDSQQTAIECRNKCIDGKLDQIVTCSLPFMTSKWPHCETLPDAKEAFDKIRDFYYGFNSSECVCRRLCQERLFSPNTNTGGKRHDNNTGLIIQFADNLVEQVVEQYAYSFSALVSDIGGSLGIFLGLSIISILKMFETAVDEFKKKV